MRNFHIWASLCLLVASLAGVSCSKQESASDQGPQFLSLTLTVDGVAVEASIGQPSDTIVLKGVTNGESVTAVTYQLSDKAGISPRPESLVGKWPKSQSFMVYTVDKSVSYVVTCPDMDEDSGVDPEPTPTPSETSLRIVGYLPSYRSDVVQYGTWKKCTHLNLSFAYVASDGTLDYSDISKAYKSFIPKAKAEGVKVLVSVGGGGGSDTQYAFATAIHNTDSRKTLVEALVKMAQDLDLDGIDIDYEAWGISSVADNNTLGSNLEDVVSSLRTELGTDKLITSAVAPYGKYTSGVISAFDFVTVMAYDKTGPWGSAVGAHSPYDYFVSTTTQFINMGFPKDKVVGGVPFYGYCFPNGTTSGAYAVTYATIVADNPGAENEDCVNGNTWYDGFPAITKKCQYVLDNGLGGIMFWELGQDSLDENLSLLNKIASLLNE